MAWPALAFASLLRPPRAPKGERERVAWPALDSACLLACWPSFSRQRERENPEGKGKGEGKDESGNLPPFPAQAPCPKGERSARAGIGHPA